MDKFINIIRKYIDIPGFDGTVMNEAEKLAARPVKTIEEIAAEQKVKREKRLANQPGISKEVVKKEREQ